MGQTDHFDVVIIGAGLAGLSLARQLLLYTGKRILLLDRRPEIPPRRQKVGESSVQVGAYYYSKVLGMEEHLFREHYMKYNLRFYWKTAGRENSHFEEYGHCFIRQFSNIACYQLDRNKFEGELLRVNRQHPNFEFGAPALDLDVSLNDSGPHTVRFNSNGQEVCATAEWVVDTSGRRKFLARDMEMSRPNAIHHGASFMWVDGLVDIDKLTDLSPKQIRLKKERAALGHAPFWLATNHFMGEGFWFWVIPLQGKTSLGLVFDNQLFPWERVATAERLLDWACQEFPLFARDLPNRKILDHSMLRDFAHECTRTISEAKWALSGEAGRFTDPLYSPGSDMISVHNTLITDAIMTEDRSELASKCRLYEELMEAIYEAYIPTYAVSYDVLGDQEAFALKYTWELAVYFAFYVFPFINDLFTDRRFVLSFLGKFSRLGMINRKLQEFISAFYQWKKAACLPAGEPIFHELTSLTPLRTAESAFYVVGVTAEEAARVLDTQLASLKELARFIVAHITSVVAADESLVSNRAFVESINFEGLRFDPEVMREQYESLSSRGGVYHWSFDAGALRRFQHVQRETLMAPTAERGAEWMTMRL